MRSDHLIVYRNTGRPVIGAGRLFYVQKPHIWFVMLISYHIDEDAEGARKQDEEDGRKLPLFEHPPKKGDGGDDEKDQKGAPVEEKGVSHRSEAENLRYEHREGGRKNEPDDGGADARKHALNARVLQKVFDERRDDEDDDKGREDDAQRRGERS